MAKGNFNACHSITRKWEGGDVDHPDDPGGLTSRGVTAARGAEYRKKRGMAPKTVTKWTDQEVVDFYVSEFWNLMRCDGLLAGVDLAVYDAGVNSGPGRSRKWLLASLGGDGMATVKAICAKRLGFVQALKIWKTFGKGWARRVTDIEARGVAMWLVATNVPRPAEVLAAEAGKARTTASRQDKGAVATGATGTGGTLVVEQSGNGLGIIIAIGVVTAIVAVVLIVKANQNKARVEAYTAAAKTV